VLASSIATDGLLLLLAGNQAAGAGAASQPASLAYVPFPSMRHAHHLASIPRAAVGPRNPPAAPTARDESALGRVSTYSIRPCIHDADLSLRFGAKSCRSGGGGSSYAPPTAPGAQTLTELTLALNAPSGEALTGGGGAAVSPSKGAADAPMVANGVGGGRHGGLSPRRQLLVTKEGSSSARKGGAVAGSPAAPRVTIKQRPFPPAGGGAAEGSSS